MPKDKIYIDVKKLTLDGTPKEPGESPVLYNKGEAAHQCKGRNLEVVYDYPNLEELHVSNMPVKDSILVAGLKKLRKLTLSNTCGFNLEVLEELPCLDEVCLCFMSLKQEEAAVLSRLKKLKKLDLNLAFLPSGQCEVPEKWENEGFCSLENLNLRKGLSWIRALGSLHHLRELYWFNNDDDTKELKLLDGMENLRRLKIEKPEGVLDLSGYPKLEVIELSYITNLKEIRGLSECKLLREIDLERTKITDITGRFEMS